ncbi:ATP-binding cassette domain-containing protein [Neobacillus sp. LXY-4]|uniref:ATP-binding cassette domain-containing protein n=1 Tax=Neobacillus sp. LXY-4 TaxID=3379826 RepID=UPI003EE18C7E
MAVVECNGLTKVFLNSKALNGISFKLEENKITGLIGRNGAGKTTLLKIISGYFEETSGEINVFSEKPFNNLTVSANLIFIHDEMNLPASLSLKEILDVAGSFYENWDVELADRLFHHFSFNTKETYTSLSKGMKCTFLAIIGLAAHCPLTIFDEPTSGMDAGIRKDFYRALLKDYLAHPRNIIISTHHLNEMEDLLEDILLIKDGKELLHLPAADLKEWAIGFQGKDTVVKKWADDREVLYSKSVGLDSTYVVVKNDFSQAELDQVFVDGVLVTPVSLNDLCIYLTGNPNGGIDYVFNQSKSC